jgi:DNA-binding transcriptional LysR family regulator
MVRPPVLDEAQYRPTREFGNTVMAIQAAAAGLGVMVVPELFVRAMLAEQTLQVLPYETVKTGYYFIATQPKRKPRAVARFMDRVTRADGA